MSGIQAKGGKHNRKFGRNKIFCERYKIENRRRRNKIRRLKHRISVNAKLIARKVKVGRIINLDIGAIKALEALR